MDAVYALKDEVHELKKVRVSIISTDFFTTTSQEAPSEALHLHLSASPRQQENKWMKQFLEDEQKSRKELERIVRKLAKQKNDCAAWDDGGGGGGGH